MPTIHPFALTLLLGFLAPAAGAAELVDVEIKSSADGSLQPARWFAPEGAEDSAVPLLVVLHTWSGDYRQSDFTKAALPACEQHGWALIHPNFRGPNTGPEACASPAAIADVLDAVEFAKSQANIDARRIYLVGTSGGGHMALMMAASSPRTWAAVSAWVPVVDLAAWHKESQAAGSKYWRNLEAVCGGPPGKSVEVDRQYAARSPLTHLASARGVAIDLNVGIHDGHIGSIPVSHSLRAFNILCLANGLPRQQLPPRDIIDIQQSRKIPQHLQHPAVQEERLRPIVFRRSAGPVRLTVFDGGHEGDIAAAVRWLAAQQPAK